MLPRWSHDTKFTAFILRGIIIDGYNSTFTVLIWSSGSRRAGWIFFRRWEVWGLWEFDEIGLSGPFLSGEVAASDDLFESGGLNEGWVKRGQKVMKSKKKNILPARRNSSFFNFFDGSTISFIKWKSASFFWWFFRYFWWLTTTESIQSSILKCLNIFLDIVTL